MADASEVEKSLNEAVGSMIKYNKELEKRGVKEPETSEKEQEEEPKE